MYDELTGNLRAQATHFSVHDETSLLLLKAADAIEDLDNRLNLHRQGKIRRWIPVTERLPPIGEDVIVFADRTTIRIWSLERYHPTIADVFWEREDGYHEDTDAVTHWMPLPEPPKADKDGEE